MGNSILVPLNDSVSSRGVLEFLLKMSLCQDSRITLIHLFRKPSSGEELMGKKFMAELPARYEKLLQNARKMLIEEKGFDPEKIKVELVEKTYPTITDGIVEYYNSGEFDLVVIGRKEMSKSEEFVLGDISVKLIRTLPKASILVVKTG